MTLGEFGVIGAFARMLGSRERLISYEETTANAYSMKARNDDGQDSVSEAADAPPEAFVQRISDEGGDVYVAPVLEALRLWIRRRIAGSEQAADDGTLPSMPDNQDTPGGTP